jgi:hypothetical protein
MDNLLLQLGQTGKHLGILAGWKIAMVVHGVAGRCLARSPASAHKTRKSLEMTRKYSRPQTHSKIFLASKSLENIFGLENTRKYFSPQNCSKIFFPSKSLENNFPLENTRKYFSPQKSRKY